MGLTSKDKSKGPSRQGSRNDKSASRSLIGSTSGKGKPLKKRDPHHENHVDDFPRFRAKLRSTSRESHHDACFNCLRTAVHCYNILILVLGLGVLGVGIWLLVTEYSAREVSVLVGSNLFEVGTYLMIAGGGTIALLAFCGCCGTMREDRCVLAFYGITLTIVLIALCVGSGVTFVFRGYLSDNIKRHFLATLTDKYGVDLRRNSENRLITDAWDSMQRRLECCGAHGNINSSFSWAVYKGHSKWYHQQNLRVPLVPDSCCKDKNKSVCNGVTQIDGPPTFGPPVTPNKKKNEFLNTDGCFDKLVIHMNRNSLILGIIAAAVPVLLLVGIIIVFCLCARVKKSDDEVDL